MKIAQDILIGLQVHDKGKLIFDNVQPGHSWTRNYYHLMLGQTTGLFGCGTNNFGAGYASLKKTDGTNVYSSSQGVRTYGGITVNSGVAYCGLMVGTGDTAFSFDNYVLATPIANGTGSGQLSYQAGTNAIPTYGSKTWSTAVSRLFINNSGSLITVKETGLVTNGWHFAGSGVYILLERSVLSPTVDVANGAQLTVTYTISSSFAAID